MKVAVAFDHRGVHLRDAVLESLAGHDVTDFGTDTDAVLREVLGLPDERIAALRQSGALG